MFFPNSLYASDGTEPESSWLDPLYDILQSFFCWLITQFFDLSVSVLSIITQAMPNVTPPEWLYGSPFSDSVLGFVGWVIPFDSLFWGFGVVVSVELVNAVGVPLYRAFMNFF